MTQPWFDPAGFFLVVTDPAPADSASRDSSAPGSHKPGSDGRGSDGRGSDRPAGEVAAFHWTKIAAATGDPTRRIGEVYAVGVRPAYQGHGLGRWVTAVGLDHLLSSAVAEVELYVESDNEPALRTYRSLGFTVAGSDLMFARRASAPDLRARISARDAAESLREHPPVRAEARTGDLARLGPDGGPQLLQRPAPSARITALPTPVGPPRMSPDHLMRTAVAVATVIGDGMPVNVTSSGNGSHPPPLTRKSALITASTRTV